MKKYILQIVFTILPYILFCGEIWTDDKNVYYPNPDGTATTTKIKLEPGFVAYLYGITEEQYELYNDNSALAYEDFLSFKINPLWELSKSTESITGKVIFGATEEEYLGYYEDDEQAFVLLIYTLTYDNQEFYKIKALTQEAEDPFFGKHFGYILEPFGNDENWTVVSSIPPGSSDPIEMTCTNMRIANGGVVLTYTLSDKSRLGEISAATKVYALCSGDIAKTMGVDKVEIAPSFDVSAGTFTFEVIPSASNKSFFVFGIEFE